VNRYFLGVDGGQSSTSARVGDESGRVVGAGVAGGCHQRGSVGKCVKMACAEAKIDPDTVRFEAACLGFSGGAAGKRALAERVVRTSQLVVTDDAEIALMGATGGEPGIVTIAGTGSISYGQNEARRRARAGGWGYLFGDEGGALDIVRQAVRAAVRHEEGWGPETRLHGVLLEATGTRTANEMMHSFYGSSDVRRRIARHASLVDRVAAEGDEIARGLLGNAAQQLATFTAAVRKKLFRPEERVLVAYVGGVFGSTVVLERFQMLIEMEEGNTVLSPRSGPAEGALAVAYRAAGVSHVPRRHPESTVRR